MSIHTNLVLDISKFMTEFKSLLKSEKPVIDRVDIITKAARNASGIPDLELTKEQRMQCKQLVHGISYSMERVTFMKCLKTLYGNDK